MNQPTVSEMPASRGTRLAGSMPTRARVEVSAVTRAPGTSPGRMGRWTRSTGSNPNPVAASMTRCATSLTVHDWTGPHSTARSNTSPPAACSWADTRAFAPSVTWTMSEICSPSPYTSMSAPVSARHTNAGVIFLTLAGPNGGATDWRGPYALTSRTTLQRVPRSWLYMATNRSIVVFVIE